MKLGRLHLSLIVVYRLTVCVKLKVCVCLYVCECVPVALTEQVGLLCMGSRQSVRHTTDCGQAHCAQHAVCGGGSDTLWLEVNVVLFYHSYGSNSLMSV